VFFPLFQYCHQAIGQMAQAKPFEQRLDGNINPKKFLKIMIHKE